MINRLLEERVEYSKVEWLSSNGVSTPIVNMTNDYLLNVLRKVTEKNIIACQLEYVEEFQKYQGLTYSNWVRFFYNEYLYRKHEGIVIEESILETDEIIADHYFSIDTPKNKNIYYIGS